MIDMKFLKAQKYIKQGNTLQASNILREILSKYPNNIRAQNILNNLVSGIKKDVQDTLSQKSIDKMLVFFRGGDYESAKNLALSIIEKFSNDPLSWKVLGAIYLELGDLNKSLEANEKAIKCNPADAEIFNNLGNTYKELGRLCDAKNSYKQSIALRPNFLLAHYNLGIILEELNKFDESEICYRKAVAIEPQFFKAHSNLGILLKKIGKIEEAETIFKLAFNLEPELAEASFNYGFILNDLGKYEEAVSFFSYALSLKSDYAETYNNLGYSLQKLGKFEEAESYYEKYISLEPDKIPKVISRGVTLFNEGEFKKALSFLDSYNTKESRAYALEALYALGRIDDIYHRIKDQAELDDENLRVAAFSSFISELQQKNTAHKFCRNPLDFVHVANLSLHTEDSNSFIFKVIEELYEIPSLWQPLDQSVRNGFQTNGDLLNHTTGNLFALKSMILKEIESYYVKFKNEACSFIEKWPTEKEISSWHVILKEQGYNTLHIHPEGWLSGVIYLKVVPTLDKDEGAIEFNLSGPGFFSETSSKIIYKPQIGDIIFFPSSLHHRTIPFTTDTDRIVVSFDLLPKANSYIN